MLRVQIQNKSNCYGPGDTVRGSVIYTPRSRVYVGAVMITFSGRTNVFCNSSSEKEIFKVSNLLYENDKLTAQPLLQPGQHDWPFVFTFPETYRLPPSCIVNLSGPTAARAIFDEPWSFRASVIYRLEASLVDGELGGTTDRKYLNFSPHRLSLLEDGLMPYPCCCSPSRSVLAGIAKRKEQGLTVTLHIPRFAILGDGLFLRLSLDYCEKESTSNPPVIRLKSFHTTLHISTAVKNVSSYGGSSTQLETCNGPSAKDVDMILRPSEATDLLALDPTFILSQSLKVKPPSNTRHEVQTLIVPTFDTANIARTYRLSASVKLQSEKTTLSATFAGDELVILPNKPSPILPKGKPPELDPNATRLELPSDLPEMWSGQRGQVDTIELTAQSRPVELQ